MARFSGERGLIPAHEFFVGIDSDGCVFNTMEVKQKQCFAPCFIKHFNLHQIASIARETWEFVNLYASSRGCSRFEALSRTIALLKRRIDRSLYSDLLPDIEPLRQWMGKQKIVSAASLKACLDMYPDIFLQRVYSWSLAVDACISRTVRFVPPFALAIESLEFMRGRADVVVVSQTPHEALVREWDTHGLTGYVQSIAGQEGGTKSEQLYKAVRDRYPEGHMLMIGDAPGDLEAAKSIGALFFPIIPGKETQSWELLYHEALGRFFSGCYAGTYEQELVQAFSTLLPDNPPWEV